MLMKCYRLKKQIDLTNIKVAIESYANEIIDYDHLVELLNNYMDEKK